MRTPIGLPPRGTAACVNAGQKKHAVHAADGSCTAFGIRASTTRSFYQSTWDATIKTVAFLVLVIGAANVWATDVQQPVAIKNWPAATNVIGNVAVTGSVGVSGPVTVSGPVSMVPMVSGKAAMTTATITAASTVILKPNDGRKGLVICNSGTGVAYIAYDVTASQKDHTTFMIPAATSWTMPAGTIYTGSIAAVRNDGSALLFITELQ